MSVEPLIHSEERISLYPIVHEDLWKFYKRHISTFWTPEEISYSEDMADWNKLSSPEKYFIEMVLAFFASSDFIVNQHIETNFADKIKYIELKMYYNFQAMIEDIHSTTYADLINTYVSDETRKKELTHAVQTIPAVKKKADWARKYIYANGDDEVDMFVRRLIVFSVVEGVFFSGSFCAIFWLKKRGILPGLTFSNELISRDEGLHRDVACHIYREHIVNKLSEDELIRIVVEGVDIEKEFVSSSLRVDLIGINSKLMTKYIEYVADHLLVGLIGRKHYNTPNPFDWMTLMSLDVKTNFFEGRVSQYSKAEDGDIDFDCDF